MMRAGVGATFRLRSQQGQAYLMRWCWSTRTCSGMTSHLLADLGADLHQRVTVMSADTLGLGQLVAHDLARQRRIQRLASALLALVAGNRRVDSSSSVSAGGVCSVGASASASLRNRSF